MQDAAAVKDDFERRVFEKCTDSSLSPPREEYFFGPITAPTSTVAVPTVFEYDRAVIELVENNLHKVADNLNGEWNLIVTMHFDEVRTRSQGLTAAGGPDRFKRKPNGVWEMWSKWNDTKAGTLFEIGYLKESGKDTWSMEIGPGLQPAGWLGKLANDVSGSQGVPFYLTVDQIAKAKPPTCEALFALFPSGAPERAPGHSLNDSYQRTQIIAESNAANGIRDTVNPDFVRRLPRQTVCYSFDAAGTCRSSGESLWVPGDLEQPPDWGRFLQADACNSSQPAQIEVVLKGPAAQVNRKRVIRCNVASYLARVRKNLIDLGVKDTPSADIEPTKNPPSPAGAPRNPLPFRQTPAINGVTWTNGDPTFKDGNTTVSLSHSLIIVAQGSTSARFSIAPQGTGIILVPPPDARSRETYNSQTHQYVNSSPGSGDATGNYPKGPPPGMMTKLAPFVQVAMKAVNQAKQTPDGAKWDDQYFRNVLEPYDTLSASGPR